MYIIHKCVNKQEDLEKITFWILEGSVGEKASELWVETSSDEKEKRETISVKTKFRGGVFGEILS